ncbi:hypothetical protein L5515_003798 [Caenorhabditis briggsae]|uniref:Uncharacterized protein n=1 Tax=Caenorhabditis briggsae TaxID=6238 RepID=A0AAE9EN33_CAEBR|nr:hypothetical protein L5515_003798 [Caenorhabditis briggsae]UMM22726.1 hypothetical protein L5515_003798 [Caenorhabditis briggsae]
MERFKQHVSGRISELAEQFSSSNDVKVMLETMNDRVLSPYDIPSTSNEPPPLAVSSHTVSQNSTPKRNITSKVSEENEIIDSIDASYFIDNDEFDAIDYELKKLCDIDMCYEDIQRERFRLKSQHTVVSKKISTLIMQKSSSYTNQVGEMENIREKVNGVVDEIISIRKALALATDQTRTCLGLIANEYKKASLHKLKTTLTTIKSFHEAETRIRETIQEGNFPLAIQMLIETQIQATGYGQFNCVNDILSKMMELSTLLETELATQLSTIAVVFDSEKYRFVFTAYEMLEKTDHVAEKLLNVFTDAIETTTTAVVMDKMKEEDRKDDATYTSLCLKLDGEQASTTFREMGFVLCRSFHSYHKVLQYHNSESASDASQKIYKSLLAARSEIFLTATKRLLTLVESRDFSTMKFDHILDIVDSINRFNNLGRTYFACDQQKLAESIEKRIEIYFDRYHNERMEELSMFIENESFTLCPVPFQFTIFDLQDFEFLKESRQEFDNFKTKEELKGDNDNIELIPNDWQNPFCQAAIRSRLQSSYSQKSSDERSCSTSSAPENLKSQESFSDDPLDEPVSGPLPNLCNTALNLLRFFGRYLRMTALLPTLCSKSAPAIIDLYEFFFASICCIFGSEGAECVERIQRLVTCLDGISKKFSKDKEGNSPFRKVFQKDNDDKIYPSLSPAVQIAFIDNLYGACERIIAVNSIEFVARQLDLIRPVIESLLLEDVRDSFSISLDMFYTQVLPCQADAKTLIIDASASRCLRLRSLVESVSSVKWDIGELKSDHNPYVEQLTQDYELFAIRLRTIKESGPVNLSSSMERFFWDRTIYYSFKALVQGYGDGGKCSTEGRALMQLDFQNILLKLEPLCGVKPVPHASFVDGYIKAYYLPENGLEQWIKTHSEYSSKQLSSLLGAAAHVSKKARLRILDALKD